MKGRRRNTFRALRSVALLALLVCAGAAAFMAALPAPPALAAPLTPLPAPEKSLGVVYADGRQTEDVPLAKLESASDELFVSAYDLARIFKATKFWNPASRKLVLRIGDHRYMFTIDTRVVVIDEAAILLRVPVRYDAGSIMIPLEFISAVLTPRSTEKIELDEERLLLSIGSPAYNVTGIRLIDDAEGSRAVLNLTEELLYHMDSETPGPSGSARQTARPLPRARHTAGDPRGRFRRKENGRDARRGSEAQAHRAGEDDRDRSRPWRFR
jgi:Copper amine oxidase N-terminal domain